MSGSPEPGVFCAELLDDPTALGLFFLYQERLAHEYAGPVSGHANSYP